MATNVTTLPFKVGAATYAGIVMKRWLKLWWPVVALVPGAAFAVAMMRDDADWALLALVLLCLVDPPAMIIVYYCHALDSAVRFNLPRHTIDCDGTTLTVTYLPAESDSSDKSGSSEKAKGSEKAERSGLTVNSDSIDHSKPSAKVDQPPAPPVTIPLASLHGISYPSGAIALHLDPGRCPAMILIPYTAFADREHLRNFSRLLSYVKKES